MAFTAGLQGATINGVLVDAADTTGLIEATVKLVRANKDSTFVKGTTTDFNGVFNIKGVQPGKYLLRVSYIGYNELIKHVTVGTDGRDVNMGVITLDANTVMLQEAVVVGVKTAITVKEDTVEFNADTYKTQANAVVEDLLKRLPGVEVGTDGKITANGKEVKKILIDGKEFFADDPTVASKNIPADMVNKLQVIDRKSDLARLTGVDDGEDETVINLTVKKGMNNGWFGTVNAGYGTDNRYAGNFIANYFHEGNQLTFLGGGNNTNNLGFSDGGATRFQRFGGNRGITKSQNLGLNFSAGSKDDEHFRVGGNLLYSHSDRDTRNNTARQYLFEDSTSYYDAATKARDRGHNLRGDFRMKWEIDSFNTLDVRPNFSFNFNKSERTDSSFTRAGDAARSRVNQSMSSYRNDGKSYEAGLSATFNHKFKNKPGRSFSVNMRYNFSRVNEDGNTLTNNIYYLLDSIAYINQDNTNHRTTNSVNGRITWTEPLGDVRNARFLEFAYNSRYRYSKAEKMVYDIPDGAAGSGKWNEKLSNSFRNKFLDQSFQIGFRQVRKEYNLNVGVTVNSAMSSSENRINSARDIPSRWAWAIAPYARLRYKFSATRNLTLNYRMRANQPSINQLQPVADESNPLAIVVGNPNLKATFAHRFNTRYSDFDQQSQRSIMAMLNVNFEQNSIISTTDYDPATGGRTTTYANVNGVWNAMAMNMLSFPFGSSKAWYYTQNTFMRYASTKGYNNGQFNRSGSFTINFMPGLAFRTGVWDLELRPRYNLQTTHNSVQMTSNRNVHTYGFMFNGTYSAPFGLVVSTDLNFSSTSGYTSGYNTSQWLWNASIAYQFLRNKEAALTLSVYDILGQRKSISRNVTANYIEDVEYNSLTRYAMLMFTYRFTTFKRGEEPKSKEGEFGGPDGRGRFRDGGGRPGGFGGGRPGGFGGGRPF